MDWRFRRRPWLLLALALGCNGQRQEQPQARPIPVAPEPDGWRMGDRPLAMVTALAVGAEGESSLRITASSGEIDCAALRAAFPGHDYGLDGAAVTVDFWLSEPLRPSGESDGWSYRGGRLSDRRGSRGVIARGAMLAGVIEEADRIVVRGLDLALQDPKDETAMLQHSGDLQVRPCGRVARKEPGNPQPLLTVAIGDEQVAVNGATLREQSGRKILRLTRAPHRCDTAIAEGYDLYLDVVHRGEPPSLEHVALLGARYPDGAIGSKGKESFTIEPRADGALRLNGAIDAGGFVVRLEGEVRPQRCVAGGG